MISLNLTLCFLFVNCQIVIVTKLISAKPIEIKGSAGYETYVFPIGSTVCGWFIFVACIIPIPIVYIYSYVKEYKLIRAEEIENDYNEKPRYLEAITRNNSPRNDWGPKKKANQFGIYAHQPADDLQTKTEL